MKPEQVPEYAKEQYPSGVIQVIGAPPGQETWIGGLPSLIETESSGYATFHSYWRPTAKEVIALSEGAYIELEVISNRMVPVALNISGLEITKWQEPGEPGEANGEPPEKDNPTFD